MNRRTSESAEISRCGSSSGLSRGLVTGQLLLLAALAVTSARPSLWALALVAAGGGLGLWALVAMPLRQLRLVPEVHPAGRLVRNGPYRKIRHPMYSAVLLAAAGMVTSDPKPLRIILGAALALLLAAKLAREEKLLRAAYPDYAAYQAVSWRLVPWIW